MSQQFEKLTDLLKKLFQLDRPDLDFGFYRIMHAKSEEITQFLERDLLPQVQEALSQYKSADKAELEQELAEMEEQARKLEADPDTLPKVIALRQRIAEEAVDLNILEAEIYDHLYGFFRRYYSEGDFLSKRVYKSGVYTIPYEGEEVKLHWANADQYYIKTDEYLRNYTFRLRPDDQDDPMRVHFRLVDAAEGEHDNVKADEEEERVFLLTDEDFIAEVPSETGPELAIHFEYRLATVADWPEAERAGKSKPPAQKDLISSAEKRIRAVSNDNEDIARWIKALKAFHITANGEVADYSRLRAHLNRYTARNTFDYFIHKDLSSFLRRELDFFIKNEVLHLDDVENETAPRVEQYLSKIKVIRHIAGKIIEFLAQLEDFQKKLWLKKKFVVETSWCIRVGCIPEAFYEEIATNEAQREEWVRLCAIDEVADDLTTVEFLRKHSTLIVDTQHFAPNFTVKLLDAVDDLDEQTDGVLFHSENFQALFPIQNRYRGELQCVYIDPPYNTGEDGFPYKDSYQHSSWLAMMDDRLGLACNVMAERGSFVCHIDEHEFNSLETLIAQRLGESQKIGPIIWDKRNPKGDPQGIATQHEYLCWAVRDFADLKGSKGNLLREKENAHQILKKAATLIRKSGGKVTQLTKDELESWVKGQNFSEGEKAYCHLDDEGNVYRPVSMAWPNKKKAPDEYFEPLIHPVTGKRCPVPERGWRNPPQTMENLLREGKILFGKDEKTQPNRKYLLEENMMENVPSLYYFGGSDDALQKAMGYYFPNPKPLRMGKYITSITAPGSKDKILDYFAGSGTTGHAVIDLNREDGGRRKFILVEMGDYFDTVLLPRLKKVTYSPDWKNGKPKRFAKTEEAERSPRILKIVRLESYEDTLNNLTPKRTSAQQDALDLTEANGPESFKEQYMLCYMLDVETRGSQSLLNIDGFLDPTSYRLKVKRPGSDESRETNVDLLETFNWLLGLKVQRIFAPRTCDANFRRDDEGRLQLDGCLKEPAAGPWWFRAVSGVLPDERRALILWRKRPGGETPEGMEEDNLVLEEWFKAQRFTENASYDLIYVNGVCQLETLKAPSDAWEVRLIEDAFRRLMFESEEV